MSGASFAKGCFDSPVNAIGTHTADELLSSRFSKLVHKNTLNLGWVIRMIRNQGKAGTCCGFGVTYAMLSCARQAVAGMETKELSALHSYVQSRTTAGILLDPNDGTYIDATLRGHQVGGFMFERDYPYDSFRRFDMPKLEQSLKALHRAGMRTHRIVESGPTIDEVVKEMLSAGKGIVGSWTVGSKFEYWGPDQPPWDGEPGDNPGQHCMAILDYPNGNPRHPGSWGILDANGNSIGEDGFFTMTWEALRLARELWAIDFVPHTLS